MIKYLLLFVGVILFFTECQKKEDSYSKESLYGKYVAVDSTDLLLINDTIIIRNARKSDKVKITRQSSIWMKKGGKKAKRQSMSQSWYAGFDMDRLRIQGTISYPTILISNESRLIIGENEFRKIK